MKVESKTISDEKRKMFEEVVCAIIEDLLKKYSVEEIKTVWEYVKRYENTKEREKENRHEQHKEQEQEQEQEYKFRTTINKISEE